jgi:hypothetical protein
MKRQCGSRAVGSSVAVEDGMSPWRHLFAEGAYGALDQVIGHGTGLEDHGKSHEAALAREAEMAFASVSALPTITMSTAANETNGEGGPAIGRVDPERFWSAASGFAKRLIHVVRSRP